MPEDLKMARKVAMQSPMFTIDLSMLKFRDPKRKKKIRIVVPAHLRQRILDESHRSTTGGHFSGPRTYETLARLWWWEGMYSDTMNFTKNCPECAIVGGVGRKKPPPLHPIPVKRPFQIVGVDILDLPRTVDGNKHMIVFQDYLSKWPMVYPIPDQKAHRITRI